MTAHLIARPSRAVLAFLLLACFLISESAMRGAGGLPPVTPPATTPVTLNLPVANGGTITREATGPGGAVVVFNVSATSNGSALDSFTVTPPSGSQFPIGPLGTTVTVAAHNVSGGSASATFKVKVQDTTPPSIFFTDITQGTPAADGTAPVFFVAHAVDTVSGTLTPTCDHNSGDPFSDGDTVHCQAIDTAGNTGFGSLDISVTPAPTELDVTPVSTTLGVGQHIQMLGSAQFANGCVEHSDGTDNGMCGGGGGGSQEPQPAPQPPYNITFTPLLSVTACPGGTASSALNAQSITAAADGSVGVSGPATQWFYSGGSITATAPAGTFTGAAPTAGAPMTVTIKCTAAPATTGTLTFDTFNNSTGIATGSYTFGGTSGTMNMYGWFRRSDMPSARVDFGAATVNGLTYVIGGRNGDTAVPSVDRYDPASDTWTANVSSMPTPRAGFATVAIGNVIYTIGGNTSEFDLSSAVEAYDTMAGTWQSLPPMPTPRTNLGAAYITLGGTPTIFAVGGHDVFGNAVATVEAYAVGGGWSPAPSMATPRALVQVSALPAIAHGGGSFNGFKIVAFGGQTSDGSALSSTEVFDGTSWAPALSGQNGAAGQPVASGAGGLFGLMFAGGAGGFPASAYNLLTNSWVTTLGGLPWNEATGTGAAGASFQSTPSSNTIFLTFGGEYWDGSALTRAASLSVNPQGQPLGGTWNVVFNTPIYVPCSNTYFGGAAPAGLDINGKFNLGGFGSLFVSSSNAAQNVTGSFPGTGCTAMSGAGTGITFGSGVDGAITANYTSGANVPGVAGQQTGTIAITRQVFQDFSQNNGSDDGPSWSLDTLGSTSNAVARIDRKGRVTALGDGTTTVILSFATYSCTTTNSCATITVDATAPVLTLPADITVTASSGATSAVVAFTASAMDGIDGAVTPVCTPASGSTFLAGPTQVSCTATDAHGNQSSGSFYVDVLLTPAVSLAAPPSAVYGSQFIANASSNASTQPAIAAGGACSIAGNLVTMTSGTGTCDLTATWAADSSYAGATATASVAAVKAVPDFGYSGGLPSTAAFGSSFVVTPFITSSATAAITSGGACTNVGTLVTMTSGTGACLLTTSWPADANYQGATLTGGSVPATTVAPVVSLTGAPATAPYQSSFTVSTATSSSSVAAVSAAGACTAAGNVITMTSGTGDCVVSATWPADGNYSASAAAPLTTHATTIAPTVTFTGAPGGASYGASFAVSTTSNSSATPSITATGVCSVTGNVVTMTSGTGTCSLTATWASDGNYNGTSRNQSTTASKVAPTAGFVGLPATAENHSSFTVVTTTNASTTPTVTVSGSCTIAGDLVTITAGSGSCRVTANWAGDANYGPALVIKTVTATKIAPVVTFTGAPATAVTGATFVVATTTDDPSGVATITVTSGPCTVAGDTVTMTSGTGTCRLKAAWPADADYKAASLTQATAGAKITPVITWAAPASIVYGTALDPTQQNAVADVPGTLVYSPRPGTVLAGGPQVLHVTFTPAVPADYAQVAAQVTLMVTPATPTLAWATPAAITYGRALSGAQLNATHASAPGSFVYDPPAGTVLSAGTQTLSATFVPSNAANYAGGTVSTTIVVSQAASKITWRNPAAINYGTPLDATQLNATANVPGTFNYTPAAGTILPAGTAQTLSVVFTPSDAVNYAGASDAVAITVRQVKPTLSWAAPAPIVKGTPLSAAQLNATADVPGTFSYSSPEGTVFAVGTHNVTATFTPADTTDYLSTAKITVGIVVTK